jgi:hypothetical protein
MPTPISTCLLVGAACASGASVGVALALVGAAIIFEIVVAFGSP